MQHRAIAPGLGALASLIAIVSTVIEWGSSERGTHHGFEAEGGSYFGVVVAIGAILGLAAAVRGLTTTGSSTARFHDGDLLLAAGAAVAGTGFAHALSPEAAYTSYNSSGPGPWLAGIMGLVMVGAAVQWARTRGPAVARSVSDDIDRVFGVVIFICGVVAVILPFLRWLSWDVDRDTTFTYGALQGGLRGVGIIALPAAVVLIGCGAVLIRRHGRDPRTTAGGLGVEHLALAASSAGIAVTLALMFSVLWQRLDDTVAPDMGLFVYLLFVFLAAGSALFILQLPAREVPVPAASDGAVAPA